jgi:hypothetical protein
MRKRRLLLRVGALALLGAAGFLLYCWAVSPTPGVTEKNFRRLRVGMSVSEVEALFGGSGESPTFRSQMVPPLTCWKGEGIEVIVAWDSQESLLYAGLFAPSGDSLAMISADYEPPSFWDRLRAWLGL